VRRLFASRVDLDDDFVSLMTSRTAAKEPVSAAAKAHVDSVASSVAEELQHGLRKLRAARASVFECLQTAGAPIDAARDGLAPHAEPARKPRPR
jgi:hypothetical protein